MSRGSHLDPFALADRQLASDRARTARFPDLLARKLTRMCASPLAFLRGAAPLFYELLAARPELGQGPDGEGWIVGDLHLENFGAYRPEALGDTKKHGAIFSLNDFDDAIIGPWRLDLLRLTTSLLLGGRELGASGVVALSLCERLLEAWADAAVGGKAKEKGKESRPGPVERLVAQVDDRTRLALLDARTRLGSGGVRQFVRGPRYADLLPEIVRAVPDAFARYTAALPDADRPPRGSLDILDCALRIAGTGSLGGLRVAVLVKGKGGPDGAWIFDMKEQDAASAAAFATGGADLLPAERVAEGFRRCVPHPPRMMGVTSLPVGGRPLSMFVRRLSPQEDKLNLKRLDRAELPALTTYLGTLVGAAHARAATRPPTRRWTSSDLEALLERAVLLAGIHEAVYLAMAVRSRELLPRP